MEDTMLGVLKDFESTVVSFWRAHPELTDHAVRRVYEAAIAEWDAALRGRRPRPNTLTGLDAELHQRIMAVGQYRSGQGPRPEGASDNIVPQPLEAVCRSVRELEKSVGVHTQRSGRQGYLTYVASFLPP